MTVPDFSAYTQRAIEEVYGPVVAPIVLRQLKQRASKLAEEMARQFYGEPSGVKPKGLLP